MSKAGFSLKIRRARLVSGQEIRPALRPWSSPEGMPMAMVKGRLSNLLVNRRDDFIQTKNAPVSPQTNMQYPAGLPTSIANTHAGQETSRIFPCSLGDYKEPSFFFISPLS